MTLLNNRAEAVSSFIAGVGFNLPPKEIPNSYFESYLETNDEWIRDRTGIETRYWVDGATGASELAEPACRQALKDAGLEAKDLDGIIVGTVTPDYVFPSTACMLQKRLDIGGSFAFDLSAACSGFIYSLTNADALIKAGLAKNILVVGVDIYSTQILDKNDRSTVILFGDGAGAVVLSATSSESGDSKILGAELRADGRPSEILRVNLGSACPVTAKSLADGKHVLHMEGRDVFKLAVRSMADVSEEVLKKTGYNASQIDYVVAHQANKRILDSMAKHFGLPEEKLLMNVQKYGNTSAASVPILLAESVQQGTIKRGDVLLLTAFGAGLSWGSILLKY